MKDKLIILILCFSSIISAQSIDLISNKSSLKNVNTKFSEAYYKDQSALKVIPMEADSEAKFVKLNNVDFSNGIIEIEVAGNRAKEAGEFARGFVGIAFRINDENSRFECFYIRPTNGRANDQLRRNHSVQYISFPDYPWHKLRKDSPGMYETYSDLVEGEWTKLRIEVKNDMAKLYVGGAEQPTLIVNDLKHGADNSGSIGLWVGPGTEAYFTNLKITNE